MDDFSRVEADAVAQVLAGANILDVNSGAVFSNKMAEDPRYADNNFVEPALMKQLIEKVQAVTDIPLCIDSSVPGALENGLAAAEGRPLLNSVTGEEERLELVLPLVKKYNVPVVAISNDDTGRRLREELGVNTTCGASNISFGLPNRHGINNAFLPMAMAAGMTSAIMNPVALPIGPKKIAAKKAEVMASGIILPEGMDDEAFVQMFGLGSTKPRAGSEMEAIRAANFLTDNDPSGAEWIKANRVAPKEGEGRARRGRRNRG